MHAMLESSTGFLWKIPKLKKQSKVVAYHHGRGHNIICQVFFMSTSAASWIHEWQKYMWYEDYCFTQFASFNQILVCAFVRKICVGLRQSVWGSQWTDPVFSRARLARQYQQAHRHQRRILGLAPHKKRTWFPLPWTKILPWQVSISTREQGC